MVTMHPGIAGWSFGLQENDLNGERVFEHGGDIAGFSALMVLLPDRRTGFFIASHREGAALRFTVEKRVLDLLFPDQRNFVKPAVSGTRAQIAKFAGRYRWNLLLSDVRHGFAG